MSEAAAKTEDVLYEVSEGVGTITLNRPERMNTISGPMLNQLCDHLLAAEKDREVRCVLLTGTGRAFCAGLDLNAAAAGTGIASPGSNSGVSVTIDLRHTPPTMLYSLEKPVVCAINGAAAGYGMDTALGADIRVMGESSRLAPAFVKRGIVPESGGTWYLPRLIGWAKAAEIIYTGKTLSAAECLEMGLTNHVVPDDQLQSFSRQLALDIAANAPLAVQSSKRLMRMGMEQTFNDHVHHVYLNLLALLRSEDAREGMVSFVEKRSPNFKGR